MLQRLLSAVVAVLFLIAVFLLTSLLVAAALAAGLLAYGWLWWRSRRQRARVIEGEYRIIESR
jgi:Flp pilus assembly protein TadB